MNSNISFPSLKMLSSAKNSEDYKFSTRDNIAPGNYLSKITKIEIYEKNGEIAGIDFFHKLENDNFEVFKIRFRMFIGSDELAEFADSLSTSGFKSIEDAVCLEETVTIDFGIGDFMRISKRSIKNSSLRINNNVSEDEFYE